MPVDTAQTLDRWNSLIERVRGRVPYYRGRLPARGLTALDEVSDLPFTTKQDLRDGYPLEMLAVPASEVVRVHMSSGTTGKPVVTGYTRADLELWAECMERVFRAGDVTAEDVVQNAYGYGLFTGGFGFHMGAERIGCTVLPTSSGATLRQVMLMRDLGTSVLACTPSYALVLAEAVAHERCLGELRLRCGFFGAEPWSEGMRRELKAGLGLEPFDIYGLTELGGPGVAVECHRHRGLHVFEDHFHVEAVDPATGLPAADGEEGELVLTSLRREASPVIRYRTGDRTILTGDPCACGSPFKRMLRVRGRTDDMLVVRGENVFPSQIEEVLLQVPGLTPNYQLFVDRRTHALDSIEVRVESTPGADAIGLARAAEIRVRETIGLGVAVTVVEPGTLPRSEGKAKRVIDLRDL